MIFLRLFYYVTCLKYNMLFLSGRFSGHCLTYTALLEYATGTSNLRIFWYTYLLHCLHCLFPFSFWLKKILLPPCRSLFGFIFIIIDINVNICSKCMEKIYQIYVLSLSVIWCMEKNNAIWLITSMREKILSSCAHYSSYNVVNNHAFCKCFKLLIPSKK